MLYYTFSKTNIIFRNFIACVFSIAFYAFGEKKFIFVLVFSILLNYIATLLIDKFNNIQKKKASTISLILIILFNAGILFLWKYLNFTIFNINLIFGEEIIRQTHAILPIGLSFYTFQAISYNVDVYRGHKPQKNLINATLYLLFFPQLVAGPIIRYDTIRKELEERHETIDDFVSGIKRFIIGLAKKIIIANNISIIAEYTFSHETSVVMAWIGAICYTLQIYFDFSGYSDMAIGLGRMFGFHYEENFNYPYIASSITDFWRRWHISLSSWFRDYVYIPLGGSKVSVSKHIFNLLVVWLLTGIWHGANWTFLLWGLTYFIFLVIEKYLIHPEKFKSTFIKIIYSVLTLLIVNFEWVIFNSSSIKEAMLYISSMFNFRNNSFTTNELFYIKEYSFYLLSGLVLAFPVFRYIKNVIKNNDKLNTLFTYISPVIYIVLLFFAVSYLIISAHNPFIYFNF